jgi:hypothetical protein
MHAHFSGWTTCGGNEDNPPPPPQHTHAHTSQEMDDVVVAQKIASANEDIAKDAHGFMPKERSVGIRVYTHI